MSWANNGHVLCLYLIRNTYSGRWKIGMKNWEKSTCFKHDCSSIFSMLWLAAGHLFLKLVGYWWVEQITATFYLIRNIGRCYNFCLLSWRGGRIRKHSAVMHMFFRNWKFSGFLPSKDLNFPPYPDDASKFIESNFRVWMLYQVYERMGTLWGDNRP